jgi:hypothetical protein
MALNDRARIGQTKTIGLGVCRRRCDDSTFSIDAMVDVLSTSRGKEWLGLSRRDSLVEL